MRKQKKTDYAKWQSVMAKLDYQMHQQALKEKKEAEKKGK